MKRSFPPSVLVSVWPSVRAVKMSTWTVNWGARNKLWGSLTMTTAEKVSQVTNGRLKRPQLGDVSRARDENKSGLCERRKEDWQNSWRKRWCWWLTEPKRWGKRRSNREEKSSHLRAISNKFTSKVAKIGELFQQHKKKSINDLGHLIFYAIQEINQKEEIFTK